MAIRTRVFLDTSALFAGIWSSEGGGRVILKLGEAGILDLLVSPQVLAELDGALRRKAPHLLPSVALLLDMARIQVTQRPTPQAVEHARRRVSHPGDALVLAAALDARPDYFVTLDRRHFLSIPEGALPFPIGTPGDFLAWWRAQIFLPPDPDR